MDDNGLSEAEERYIFNEVGENELMVARINDVIKTARLQTLEDVEKALMKRTVINECGISVYAKHILDEIKTLREAL